MSFKTIRHDKESDDIAEQLFKSHDDASNLLEKNIIICAILTLLMKTDLIVTLLR